MTSDANPFDPANPAVWPVTPSRLVELAPNGWLLVDRKGFILLANAKIEEMFGFAREELLSQSVELLVPESLRDVHIKHRTAFVESPISRPMGLGMNLVARRKTGVEFPVEISLSPVETPGDLYVIAVVRDITDRIDLEEERNHFRMELEMERERDRIGMDLHDGIMQEIYGAGLGLELALGDMEDAPKDAERQIERTIDALHEVIRHIRSYIFDLRPRQFSGSLSGALRELAGEFTQNTQIEVLAAIPELLPEIDDQRANVAYLIMHEALSNVRKHANAKSVQLSATATPEMVIVELKDDGDGFTMDVELPQIHRGLRNMQARARQAEVTVEVTSTPGQGTTVRVEIPVGAPNS
jgi:PAS domain S-box-containing protein